MLTRFLASHVDFKEVLERIEDQIRDQHAEFLRDQLHDGRASRRGARAALPDFRHDVSPFQKLLPLDKAAKTVLPAVEAKSHVRPSHFFLFLRSSLTLLFKIT